MEFSGKCCVAKDFGNFCFWENFFEGVLEWKGAQILEYTPPQPETGWHGPGAISPWWVGVGQGQGETNVFRGDVHTHIATQYVILTFSF
jgi:hypothetical protein